MCDINLQLLRISLAPFVGLVAMACSSASGLPAEGSDDSTAPPSQVESDIGAGEALDSDGDEASPDAEADAALDDVGSGPSEDVEVVDLCQGVTCDDGLACTLDGCDPGSGACSWTLEEGHCFIGGVCYTDGDGHPQDGCRACAASQDTFTWSALDEGAVCDDLDACTVQTTCASGVCTGAPLECDDGNHCTFDVCAADTGCTYEDVEAGTPCDDGSVCTVAESCVEGVCGGGEPLACDDGDPCTDEVCDDAEGCMPSFNESPCEDGSPCTAGDVCSEGVCTSGGLTNCDDGDVCTIDLCDEQVGCAHLPTQNACCTGDGIGCDDANPCTTASCDEATGECIQTPNTAPCDDDDACTIEDTCEELLCVGEVADCDDDNPCTDDLCSPVDGCLHIPQDGAPCDDALECTTGDICSGGECVGDASECSCVPVFGDAVRATFIEMGATGYPGDGLNLDADLETCAPDGDCSDGVDNSLAILAGLANDSIAEAVSSGDLNFLIELRETSPGVHLLSAFTADLAPNNPDCELATATCDWWVDKSFLDDETCMPIAALDATLDGSSITGGGVGSVLPFALPLGDSSLTVTLLNLQFQGDLVYTDGQISSFSGVFGGAVPKSALEAAINAVPDEDLPLPKAAILGFMGLLENDIDSDGDGAKDALSLGLKVSGIDAVLTGSQ